jgi:hypothetical protein
MAAEVATSVRTTSRGGRLEEELNVTA